MEVDKDTCLAALTNIQATLELMAKPIAECWGVAQRCWISPDNQVYDFFGTLNECFKDNGMRRVLRWIEFNVQDGPARRKRLAGVLRTFRDSIQFIERGNPSDPFLWARESIDAAAAAVPIELDHVCDYVGQLRQFIESIDEGDKPEFVPTVFQRSILDALDGQAMKKQELANEVAGGDGRRFYRPGGLTELREAGLVAHKPGLGYYRPSAAPK